VKKLKLFSFVLKAHISLTTLDKMRVREILSSLDSTSKAQLKKLLPKGIVMPDVETARYPSALLSALPKEDAYSLLGIIAEAMLQKELPEEITLEQLLETIQDYYPEIPEISLSLISKSKTTEPFIALLKETRTKLNSVLREPIQYNQVVQYENVEGHPDGMNKVQIFEVKLTGMLKQNWVSFIFQLFAYAALYPEANNVYLVLPLQKTVWNFNVQTWTNRKAFRDFLNTKAKATQQNLAADMIIGTFIREAYFIGQHTKKLKSLPDTINSLVDLRKPYQIFLGAPQNNKLSIPDLELAVASQLIEQKKAKIYVHSPYIINLCQANATDDWNTNLLIKNLTYANTIGCKGVVVHVGKSTDKPLDIALENMKENLMKALQHASKSCPLLLETPAGQGTETLKDREAFIDFVIKINDKRLRICLDTCHVFACGHKPLEYIQKVCEHSDLCKLIHYNDSAAPCGSCVDRHAWMGTGHIGMDGMKQIAEFCASKNLPMVIE
jgi:deoxyribonuclease IV